MKYSFKDISKVKTGTRTQLNINIKSLENVELFVDVMFKKVCRCGYHCTKVVFHDLLRSTVNLKYYINHPIGVAETLFSEVKHDYNIKLKDRRSKL